MVEARSIKGSIIAAYAQAVMPLNDECTLIKTSPSFVAGKVMVHHSGDPVGEFTETWIGPSQFIYDGAFDQVSKTGSKITFDNNIVFLIGRGI